MEELLKTIHYDLITILAFVGGMFGLMVLRGVKEKS